MSNNAYGRPDGVSVNYENPSDTLYLPTIAAIVVGVVLTTLFTSARLIAKRAVGALAVEDCECRNVSAFRRLIPCADTLIAAWAMNIAYNILLIVGAQLGLTRHAWDAPPSMRIRTTIVRPCAHRSHSHELTLADNLVRLMYLLHCHMCLQGRAPASDQTHLLASRPRYHLKSVQCCIAF